MAVIGQKQPFESTKKDSIGLLRMQQFSALIFGKRRSFHVRLQEGAYGSTFGAAAGASTVDCYPMRGQKGGQFTRPSFMHIRDKYGLA